MKKDKTANRTILKMTRNEDNKFKQYRDVSKDGPKPAKKKNATETTGAVKPAKKKARTINDSKTKITTTVQQKIAELEKLKLLVPDAGAEVDRKIENLRTIETMQNALL